MFHKKGKKWDPRSKYTFTPRRNYTKSKLYFAELVVSELDYSLGPYYLTLLESTRIPFDIRTSLRKVSDPNPSRFLKRLLSERRTELRMSGTSLSGNERLKRQIGDLETIVNQYEREEVPPLNFSILIRIYADHPVLLNERLSRIIYDLKLIGIETKRVKSSKRAIKDFFLPDVNAKYNYLMNTRQAATIVPIFREAYEPSNGVIVGVDDISERIVYYDMFAENSHNALIIGETGSGKSYFAKLLVTRNIRAGYAERAIIFDPLNEYFCSFFDTNCTEVDIRDFLRGGHQKSAIQFPTFSVKIPGSVLIIKANSEDLGEDHLISDLLRELNSLMVGSQGKKTIMLIDESHIILKNPSNGKTLSQMVRHSRHFNTAIINISQNTDDFLNDRNGSLAFNSNRIFIFRTRNFKESHKKVLKLEDFDIETPERLMGGKMHPYSECIITDGDYCRKLRVISTVSEDSILQCL